MQLTHNDINNALFALMARLESDRLSLAQRRQLCGEDEGTEFWEKTVAESEQLVARFEAASKRAATWTPSR